MRDFKSENQKLLERLIKFASKTISLCNELPQTTANLALVKQLVRCVSSIGANYSEACAAESAKDFVHKLKIAAKEARETRFFLRLLLEANKTFSREITILGKESTEYVKIFSTIISKFKAKP